MCSSDLDNNLSTYTIEQNIIENYTTQNEVLEIFGTPQKSLINNNGDLVWTYFDVTINTAGYNILSTSIRVGKGGHFKDNKYSQYNWIVTFNPDGIVTNSQIKSPY